MNELAGVVGSLIMIAWALLALVRPEAFYTKFYTKKQHELLKSSQLNRPLDWYVSTRAFRVSMRIAGSVILVIAVAMLTGLLRQRLSG